MVHLLELLEGNEICNVEKKTKEKIRLAGNKTKEREGKGASHWCRRKRLEQRKQGGVPTTVYLGMTVDDTGTLFIHV